MNENKTLELALRQSCGVDTVRMHYREEILRNIESQCNIFSMPNQELQNWLDFTHTASIGQLFKLKNLGQILMKVKLLSLDKHGNIFVDYCGMYGCLDLDGNINT